MIITPFFTYVLVPCLNEDRVIGNTLNALLRNKVENIQFIVIDDDSSDNTLNIVTQFQDARLHVLTRELPNAQKGKEAALNFALNTHILPEVQARTQNVDDVIIAVMDADSYIKNDYFNQVSTLFASNPHIQAIQSKVKIVPNTNTLFDLTQLTKKFKHFTNQNQQPLLSHLSMVFS